MATPTRTAPTEAPQEPPTSRRFRTPEWPILDPDRWTPRHARFALVAGAVVLLAWMVEAAQVDAANGLRAAFGAAVGMALVGLALSLRGVTLPGLALGGFVVLSGIVSWTWTQEQLVPWSVYALGALALGLWTFPWFREALLLPRLGTFYLGVVLWPLGVIGAVLTADLGIAAQRTAFLGLALVTALAVVVAVRRTNRDPSVGVVAAFLLAIAALVLVGSGNVFDDVHAVPGTAWGNWMQARFWGGPGLLYHPNSLAAASVIVALRIGPDRAFRAWQRCAALAVVTLICVLTNSRTALVFVAAAAFVHALLVWRQWRAGQVPPANGLPSYSSGRRTLAAALVPLALVGVIFVGQGGVGSLTRSRYVAPAETDAGGADVTSGRTETWKRVFADFRGDTVAEKVFGNSDHARGAVVRATTGPVEARPKLTTDNAAVGALRRGGILGVVAFLVGLGLLLYHTVRRRAPAWLTIATLAALPTILTTDWLL
ncbi:MAG TPA: O-antigen ligase family protein, partial [Cryptosporangiaceae bacterium]|nr:O-antigen ligase family protein [Cryptosporangiaceae bacterium]